MITFTTKDAFDYIQRLLKYAEWHNGEKFFDGNLYSVSRESGTHSVEFIFDCSDTEHRIKFTADEDGITAEGIGCELPDTFARPTIIFDFVHCRIYLPTDNRLTEEQTSWLRVQHEFGSHEHRYCVGCPYC